jgi:hypothetical protein
MQVFDSLQKHLQISFDLRFSQSNVIVLDNFPQPSGHVLKNENKANPLRQHLQKLDNLQ